MNPLSSSEGRFQVQHSQLQQVLGVVDFAAQLLKFEQYEEAVVIATP